MAGLAARDERPPPGRAGRLWLDRRLGAARRGADLLDRKLRILQRDRADRQAADAEREWHPVRGADQALLLAALLGGQRGVRLASAASHAQVRIGYTITIGVRHPADGSAAPPAGPDPWAGQPVEQARLAHRAALAAAVTHAVAAQAVRIIEAETLRPGTGCALSGTG